MTHDRDEAAVSGALRAASEHYGDLPDPVADRLDRVLDQLPAADTLHGTAADPRPTWTERLRPARVRYALLSGVAALLLVIGGVAVAVQYVSDRPGDTAASTQDDAAGGQSDDGGRGEDEAAASESDGAEAETGQDQELSGEQNEEAPDQAEEPSGTEESSSVETFATGRDYTGRDDLLTALRDLGNESTYAGPPPELETLAEGAAWQTCQNALAERYSSLLVAVDFARYETEPAVVALLTSDSGDIAVAVTAACGDGVIEQLALQ
ncbi:hypothetical protein GCM10029992_11810 [Glycomyces albus]